MITSNMHLAQSNKPNTINFIKTNTDAVIRKGSKESAGYDLMSLETVMLAPHHRHLFDIGIRLEEPTHECIYMRIASRSSLALKCVDVCGGVVDCDYTGNIKVLLCNNGTSAITINKGDYIAQLILEQLGQFHVCINDKIIYSEKIRDDNGFGSSEKTY